MLSTYHPYYSFTALTNLSGLYTFGSPYGSYSPESFYGIYSLGSFYRGPFSQYGSKKPVKNDKEPSAEPTIYVNIQIDADISPGAENIQGLINIIDELKRRNIKTTVFVAGEFANQAQLLISDIYNEGFEIALHGYHTGEQLATMSYSEQKNILTNALEAVEGCPSCGTYKPVIGFRPQYFSQDPNTYLILDELGFTYNCGFKVGQEPYVEGHKDDVWPFQMEDYNFCVLPISKGDFNGQIVYLCDIGMAFGKNMSASDWSEMLSNALDRAIAQDEPLVILFHNWYTGLDMAPNPGEPGYWEPFVEFLNEAEDQGAIFITTKKLVEDFCS